MLDHSALFLQQQGHSHYAEVSLLCSLLTTVCMTVSSVVYQVTLLPPTTVCTATDSVIDQVTLLPSNNSLQHSEQYYMSGHSTPFLY